MYARNDTTTWVSFYVYTLEMDVHEKPNNYIITLCV